MMDYKSDTAGRSKRDVIKTIGADLRDWWSNSGALIHFTGI